MVLLTAATGTASFNINGTTLHSTFLLPIGQIKSCQKLTGVERNTLCVKLKELVILIIDGVSMVSSDLLWIVHQRLRVWLHNSSRI